MSAQISASLVKDLRDKTGAGMMECKKALQEAEGNLEKAVKLLRERGAAKAAKREARTAAEGLVEIAMNGDNTAAGIAELNSETDFVARNEEFQSVVKALAAAALAEKTTDAAALNKASLKGFGKSAEEVVADIRAKIGEKIELNRATYVEGDLLSGYIHPPGKIGVIVAAKLEGASKSDELQETLRSIAMHIAAANPRFLKDDEVDAATLENEKEVFTNIARKEGKPENIIPKIVEGRIKSFYKENCLVSQVFVVDNKSTIQQVVDEAGKKAGGKVEIMRFVRFQVGENAAAEPTESE